ncbi:MAG: type IV pilin N-terminal domain-containing protein, partial [Candidatus Thermoplasmatota archaeon]
MRRKYNITDRRLRAVSEMLGTILLLTIAVSIFSVLYLMVFNLSQNYSNAPTPTVSIVGTVDNNKIILEHKGGLSLPLDTKIVFVIAGVNLELTLKDTPPQGYTLTFDNLYDNDHWNIGERVILTKNQGSFVSLEIKVLVIDHISNSMLMSGYLQRGERGDQPYVQTLGADPRSYSAIVKLYYNFPGESCSLYPTKYVYFRYKEAASGVWSVIGKEEVSVCSGEYSYEILGLKHRMLYQYQAFIDNDDNYDNGFINKGLIRVFTTLGDKIGEWLFEESYPNPKVYDTSGNDNHGDLLPSVLTGPERKEGGRTGGNGERILYLEGLDDSINITKSSSINNLVDNITIDLWVKPGNYTEGYKGSMSIKNNKIFGYPNYKCIEPDIVYATGSIYAIVSRTSLITVEVSDTGRISADTTTCIKHIYNFTSPCYTPKIIKTGDIGGSAIVAVVYRGGDNKGYIQRFSISNTGWITASDNYSFANVCYYPDIIHVEGNKYAIVYNNVSKGLVCTLNIPPAFPGNPNSPNTYTFRDSPLSNAEIIKIDGTDDKYVVVYTIEEQNSRDGGISTLRIHSSGINVIKHATFDESAGLTPE